MKPLPLGLGGFQVYMSLLLLINRVSLVSLNLNYWEIESTLTLVPVQSSPGLIMGNQVFGNFKLWDLSLWMEGQLRYLLSRVLGRDPPWQRVPPELHQHKGWIGVCQEKKAWWVAHSGRTRLCPGIILQGSSSLH